MTFLASNFAKLAFFAKNFGVSQKSGVHLSSKSQNVAFPIPNYDTFFVIKHQFYSHVTKLPILAQRKGKFRERVHCVITIHIGTNGHINSANPVGKLPLAHHQMGKGGKSWMPARMVARGGGPV